MKKLMMIGLIAGIFSGCTTGTLISKEGTTNDPKWHKADAAIFNKNLGTFPNLQSLAQVRKGMTKDQLYELIGRPQYDDGWRPREWNYLFHFTTPGQGENDVTTCQYKVLFDQNMFASSFYWNPVNPKEGVCPPAINPSVERQPAAVVPLVKRYNLGADALFKFDKSNLENIKPQGKIDLDHLVAELKNFKVLNSIHISGYTDHLGTDSYNKNLSLNRADTIKQYLIQHGVNSHIIFTQGLGEENPIKQCDDNVSRSVLIDCLEPNRRVIIEVDGFIEE